MSTTKCHILSIGNTDGTKLSRGQIKCAANSGLYQNYRKQVNSAEWKGKKDEVRYLHDYRKQNFQVD